MNDQKLDNIKAQKECSIYVSSEKIGARGKIMESIFPKLFDFDAGVQFTLEKVSRTESYRKVYEKNEKTGNTQVTSKQESIIDQWA